MTGGTGRHVRIARAGSVTAFALFGVFALVISTLAASQESYTSLSSPADVSIFGLGVSSCLAAVLAGRRGAGASARLSGVLLLLPAFALEVSADYRSPVGAEEWLTPIAAWLLALIGGSLAGGLAQRAASAVLGYLRGDDLR